MDGFYPYHEMNTYIGPGRARPWRSSAPGRCATAGSPSGCCWRGSAALLMLGRFTVAARLCAPGPGARQLADPGPVPPLGRAGGRRRWRRSASTGWRGRGGSGSGGRSAWSACWSAASLPILLYEYYRRLWRDPDRWPKPYHAAPVRLAPRGADGGDGPDGGAGDARPAAGGDRRRGGATGPAGRRRRCCRWWSSPTCSGPTGTRCRRSTPPTGPSPPESARLVRADPDHQRVLGYGVFSAGEPGYASYDGRLPAGPRHARLEPAAGLGPAVGDRRDADDPDPLEAVHGRDRRRRRCN